MAMTTPKKITDEVKTFCAGICPASAPIYLSLKAEADAKVDECYVNVANKINRSNGGIQYGWMIWEWKEVLLEATFHAVWISEQGELVDITPKKDNEHQILFVSDNIQKYERRAIPSRMKALRADPNIAKFIEASGEWHNLLGRYSDETGSPHVPLEEAAPINARMARYREEIEEGLRKQKQALNPKERAEQRRKQQKKKK